MNDQTGSDHVPEPESRLTPGPDCPDVDTLWDYLMRRLDDKHAHDIAAHLSSGCLYCTDELGRLWKVREFRARRQAAVPDRAEHAAVVRHGLFAKPRFARYVPLRAAAALLLVLLGGLITGCGIAAWDWLTEREFRAFWRAFVSRTTAAVVVGNARVQTLDGQWRDDYIGTGDTRALGVLFQVLSAAGCDPQHGISLATSAELAREPAAHAGSVCFVGGPTVNKPMLDLLAAVKGADPADPRSLRRGFRFAVPKGVPENAFAHHRTDGKCGIENVETDALYEYKEGVADCAIIVRTTYQNRQILILAGFQNEGTLGAVRALNGSTRALRQLSRAFAETGYAEMVLRIPADGPEEVCEVLTAAPTRPAR